MSTHKTEPKCIVCGKTFQREHVGQDACSIRCTRIFVLSNGKVKRK